NHWYRLQVDWGATGAITGKLFDSNGTTLLKTVTGTSTAITSGGIAFNGTGANLKYWDTVQRTPGVDGSVPMVDVPPTGPLPRSISRVVDWDQLNPRGLSQFFEQVPAVFGSPQAVLTLGEDLFLGMVKVRKEESVTNRLSIRNSLFADSEFAT